MNETPDVAEPASAIHNAATANFSDPSDLLENTPIVINVGLESFADELQGQNVAVVQVDWAPPAGGDPELADLLSRLGS